MASYQSDQLAPATRARWFSYLDDQYFAGGANCRKVEGLALLWSSVAVGQVALVGTGPQVERARLRSRPESVSVGKRELELDRCADGDKRDHHHRVCEG